MKDKLRPETKAIRTQATRSAYKEHSVPIFETSGFVFDSAEEARAVFAEEKPGYQYTRFANPNTDELIAKLCALEGAEDGVATASGMASVFLGFASLLRPGDHLLCSRQVFGTTHTMITQLLTRWGVSHTYVDLSNKEEWEENILPTTRVMYCETPSNPGLELADLNWLGKLAAKHGIYLMVDNCFATPCIQNPLSLGADLVIHSATKFMDGQGRTIAGAILGNKEVIADIRLLSRIIGPTLSPFSAWILSRSLETLSIRMEHHCRSAFELAKRLETSKEIKWVKYPFLPSHPQFKLAKKQMKMGGGLVTFEPAGGKDRAMRFLNALQIASITSNLGDSRTIVTHPATTTHSRLTPEEREQSGITEGMIRMSVGLEHIEDLWEDIDQALTASI